LKQKYDVVIIGAGLQGLSVAYNLAKRGLTNVLVLEKGYLGSGASGRDIELIRAIFASPEWISLMKESIRLFRKLSSELNFNIMYAENGHMLLAKTPSQVKLCQEIHSSYGNDSRLIEPQEAKEIIPALNVEGIEGALYQESGATALTYGVLWGYAEAAQRLGVEICPFTEVLGISVVEGRVNSVTTTKGTVRTDTVVDAAGAYSRDIAKMVGVVLPNEPHRIEALVTESLKPFFSCNVVSLDSHVACKQTARGEVLGYAPSKAEAEVTYSTSSTPMFLRATAKAMLEIFPRLRQVKVQRQWGGIIDMTPDRSPTIGPVDEIDGFILNSGWGGYGFMSSPASGSILAEFIVSGKTNTIIESFSLRRFAQGRLVRDRSMIVE